MMKTENIVLGDLNTKIGARQESVIGRHGLEDQNEYGTCLIQFTFGQSLQISNSFYKKNSMLMDMGHQEATKMIFILYYQNQQNSNIIKNINSINQIKFSSEHRPLVRGSS